jgi:GNAT superfamily N-acetyltransferase
LAQASQELPGPAPNSQPQAPAHLENGSNHIPALRYEFRLFRARPDEAPQVTAMRAHAGFPTTPLDAQKEALQRRVTDALLAQNPQLQVARFAFEQIAQFEHISVEEARRRHRHLELNVPEGGNGLQIVLRDDEASVTLPFWHTGEVAAAAFLELWSYLAVIQRETGYLVFDPQIGRLLAPIEDCTEALGHYNSIVRQIREPRPVAAPEPGPPEIRELSMPDSSGAVLVATQPNGAISGYAEVCVHQDADLACAYLRAWYVEPEFCDRDTGQRLLESVERWAVARGLTALASDVKLEHARRLRLPLLSRFAGASPAGRYIRPIPLSS